MFQLSLSVLWITLNSLEKNPHKVLIMITLEHRYDFWTINVALILFTNSKKKVTAYDLYKFLKGMFSESIKDQTDDCMWYITVHAIVFVMYLGNGLL